MKPTTAAKKLGVLLTAMPAELQEREITRSEIAEWTETAPEWLAELRRNGPHPRPVVAAKLGVSISGLARSGHDEALTTAEIKTLLETMPEWLVTERATQAKVRDENVRVKSDRAEKATKKR